MCKWQGLYYSRRCTSIKYKKKRGGIVWVYQLIVTRAKETKLKV